MPDFGNLNNHSIFWRIFMKIMKKLFLAVFFAFGTASVFASTSDIINSISKNPDRFSYSINKGLDDFSDELGIAVSQAAVQQNVYADSFIRKIFPSLKPHFAVGFNAGLTHINTQGLAAAAENLGISDVKDNYYFPVMNADLRVGGVFLPFDVGFSFMKLNSLEASAFGSDITVDFFTVAADIRYAIIEEGLVAPGLSVGAGYSYNSGSFGIGNDDAEANVDYKVQTIYTSIQISKAFNIPVVKIGFTPFVGVRAVLSKYDNDYDWKIKNLIAVDAAKFAGVAYYGSGNNSTDTFGNFQPQLYGGLGFNFMVVQLTGSVCADLRHLGTDSHLWSGALSMRIKL